MFRFLISATLGLRESRFRRVGSLWRQISRKRVCNHKCLWHTGFASGNGRVCSDARLKIVVKPPETTRSGWKILDKTGGFANRNGTFRYAICAVWRFKTARMVPRVRVLWWNFCAGIVSRFYFDVSRSVKPKSVIRPPGICFASFPGFLDVARYAFDKRRQPICTPTGRNHIGL